MAHFESDKHGAKDFSGNQGLSAELHFSSSHYFLHLIFILAGFIKSLIKCFLNYVIFSESFLVNSHNLLQKQLLNVFFGCKNRVCHHNFKLDAENNGWTKNEAKTFSRKSVAG